MRHDLLITGGEAILPGTGRTRCDIAVTDGRISAILAPGHGAEADETVAADGRVILPGVIDAHLHLGHGKDISRPQVPEDADRESASAALGGVTCMIPYLMSTGPYSGIFDEVVAVTEAGSRIDFGYHPIVSTEEQLAEVPRYITEYGAPTLKTFMNNRGGEGERLGLPDIDDGFLYRLAELAAEHGGMVNPHPESIEVAWTFRARVMGADPEGTGGLAAWDATRPGFVEGDAVQRAAYLANQAGAPLYVVHTSSTAALEAALARRLAGDVVHLETCPHYLTHDVTWEGGVVGKINPPLRHPEDRERLWQAIHDGDIDTVATDHVHRDITSKDGGIWKASPGCPGMETLLPVMLTEGYRNRGLPLERIVALLCETPARLMGLSDRKGRIAVGLDADLALVDLDAEYTLRREDVVSSAGYSIYEGWTFQGKVTDTFVRGRGVVRAGALVPDAAGTGRYQHRTLRH
ncbi:dihydroorotase [Roseivivax isoporae]|uniref:Dihydroorotase n=1 Tax=Roseivivax isoporae LMG 25204 TaxID=1449351 RepID=X7FBQ0_9RHOB|nr:dihydroorotase family protein [Roseivivax isoporae]ETX30337.1 dihydroorotase [Roseivivax isoporae LMG 25204]